MLVRLMAAAIDEPLGAPGVVSLSSYSSTGNSGNTAGVGLSGDGFEIRYFFGVPIEGGLWVTPQENFSEYEVYATVLSGDTPVGTVGAWTSLATTQEWTLTESTPASTLTCSLQLEVRWTGNNEVQDTATYTITSNG